MKLLWMSKNIKVYHIQGEYWRAIVPVDLKFTHTMEPIM